MNEKRKQLQKKFLRAYIAWISMPLFALAFSLVQGASWRPVLVGAPVYLTFFVGITYQFIKELRALARDERDEPPPPPWKSPWEED
ncbi:hypothetical protein C7418_4157 [Cupriavidus plantarum]|nr:hypothetical protein C7418_4157 [Cupriavidus plantarum]